MTQQVRRHGDAWRVKRRAIAAGVTLALVGGLSAAIPAAAEVDGAFASAPVADSSELAALLDAAALGDAEAVARLEAPGIIVADLESSVDPADGEAPATGDDLDADADLVVDEADGAAAQPGDEPADAGHATEGAARGQGPYVVIDAADAVLDALDADEVEPGYAYIDIRVGGDRTGMSPWSRDAFAAGEVAPLEGATFRLYRGGATGSPQRITHDWALATSGPDGIARFRIPVVGPDAPLGTGQGNSNAASGGTANYGSHGAQQDARFWVVQESAPTDWRTNTTLRTGPSGVGSTVSAYRFRTAAIGSVPHQISGRDFMAEVRLANGNADTTAAGLRGRSGGVWQNSRINPPLEGKCGLDIALVMDFSTSMTDAHIAEIKAAAGELIDALVGTPSAFSAYTFGWASPATGIVNAIGLRSVSTAAGAHELRTAINAMTRGSGSHATNWDHALWTVAQQSHTYDLVVLLTDGNPTTFGTGDTTTTTYGRGNQNQMIDIEAAIFSANAIKAQGTRMFAVGVGYRHPG